MSPSPNLACKTLAFTTVAVLALSCRNADWPVGARPQSLSPASSDQREANAKLLGFEECAIALAPHEAGTALDQRIAEAQARALQARRPERALETLGWLFVAQARRTYDSDDYDLAESCASCLATIAPENAGAMLLRGHVLYSLHRFEEAGALADRLVRERGSAYDYGLLGDVHLSQGRLSEAIQAYQHMMDLRPSLQAYSRAAHIRWLAGDLRGARRLMGLAGNAGSRRDPESLAWVYAEQAMLALQANEVDVALRACAAALSIQPDYAPALLARGRTHLARDRVDEALADLQKAAHLDPLPEYEWALADALRLAERDPEAETVEKRLERWGPSDDPRTTSLYRATRGHDVKGALELAMRELAVGGDLFTHDALAWSLAAAGQVDEASAHMAQALSAGTQDARLWLHAGIIAAKAERIEDA